MAYDVDTFPRIVHHPQLATSGHIGHLSIPVEWLEEQLSDKYPHILQFMWSVPPYCIFTLGENNEPSVETCELMDMTDTSVLEAPGGETLSILRFI